LQRYVRKISGKSFRKTYQDIQERFHDLWTEEADARGPFMEMEQVTRTHAFATDYSNGSWIDGYYYAVREGKDLSARLVRIDSTGREHDLGPFSAHASNLNPGEHRLYWSETLPGRRWTLDGKSIIRYMDYGHRRWQNLTTEGRLYNPQPGPGGIATIEFPVQGGSNLVIISEKDGHILSRMPAPEGVQLAEPVWADEDIFCLGLNDDGYSIWKREGAGWICVLEPTVQQMENLDASDGFLEFVSDRTGVKELYRYDPATGRAWQLTNSRYGGTDYFWHGDTLWFNSVTPEGTAIFKAKAPEPVEVDLRKVHRYRVAEALAEQERGFPVEKQGKVTVSEPKRYSKLLHLVKFHSWAPIYFNYDDISSMSGDFSYDTASPGLTGLFQNELGTMYGTIGYSAHPDEDKPSEWRHSGHLQFTYTGLFPVLEAGFDLYDKGTALYSFQERRYEDRTGYAIVREPLDRVFWSGHLTAYVPLRFNKSGIQVGLTPQVSWSFGSHPFDNGTTHLRMAEDFVSGKAHAGFLDITPGRNVPMQTLRGSVRGHMILQKAESQVYPSFGLGAEAGGSFRPGLTGIYTPSLYGYVYGYVPGLTRTQGLRLTAIAQRQVATGAPFGEGGVTVMPRGFTSADGTLVTRNFDHQLRLTADYAVPIYVGDLSWFSPVAYISHFLLIPHVDWTAFSGTQKGIRTASSLVSAGADLTVELGNLLWAPFPCSVGVSASWLGGPYFKTLSESAEDGRKPYHIGLVFSMDL
jgi:hypothetical protein